MSGRQSPAKRGRPKLSEAEKKRRAKLRSIAARLRRTGLDGAKYCVLTAAGNLWRFFFEFSGWGGAKEGLDMSDLPSGSIVLRLADGVELARREGQVNMSKY